MWIKNKYEIKKESLSISDFNKNKSDIKNTIFYSKSLKGAVFNIISDVNDIYPNIKYIDYNSRFISATANLINGSTSNIIDKNYLDNYGYSVKSLFSPERAIKEKNNFIEIACATTDSLNIQSTYESLRVDNYELKENDTILVKDNKTTVTIPNSTDLNTYFGNKNYYLVSTNNDNTSTYYYFNNENGLYTYKNKKLNRVENLYSGLVIDTYVSVNGDVNRDIEYKQKPLKNGNCDISNIEYVVVNTYILKNQLSYINLQDVNYNDMIHDDGISDYETYGYYINTRDIFIGDNGIILCKQETNIDVVQNKFKYNLNSISYSDKNYFICGDKGSLLKVSRIDLSISKIDLNTKFNLNKIKFSEYNPYFGIVVGDNDTIFYTIDNGNNWKKLTNYFDNRYNKFIDIYFTSFNNLYLLTTNSLFKVDLTYGGDITNVNVSEIKPNVNYDVDDNGSIFFEYKNVNSISINSNKVSFTNDYIDIPQVVGDSDFSIDFRIKPNITSTKQYIISNDVFYYGNNTPDGYVDGFYNTFSVYLLNGRIYLQIGSDLNNVTINTNILEANKYSNITITRNSNNVNLYVNSVSVASSKSSIVGILTANGLSKSIRIGAMKQMDINGASTNTVINPLTSIIDEIRFYNVQLSDDDVTYSYNYTGLNKLSDKIVGYYRFNDVSNLGIDLTNNYNNYIYKTSFLNTVSEIYNLITVSGKKYLWLYDSINNKSYIIKTELNNEEIITYSAKIILNSDSGVYYFNNDLDINTYSINNTIDITPFKLIEDEVFNTIKLYNSYLYFIGNNTNIKGISASNLYFKSDIVCDTDTKLNSDILFNNKTSIYVTDDLFDTYIEYNNSDYKIMYDKVYDNQSSIITPIYTTNNSYLGFRTNYCFKINIKYLINGSLFISLGENIYEIKEAGVHYFNLTCGGDSSIRFNTVSRNGLPVSAKILNIDIIDNCMCNINNECLTYTYSVGSNVRKLYFPQFLNPNTDVNNLVDYNSLYYSWIDMKSLKINNSEVLNLATYSKLYPKSNTSGASTSIVLCDGLKCVINGSGNQFDRLITSFDFSKSASYSYVDPNNTNLVPYTNINMDLPYVNYYDIDGTTKSISSPYSMQIDISKPFYFEVNSMICKTQSDILNLYATYGSATISQYTGINVNGNTFSSSNNNTISYTQSNSIVNLLIKSADLTPNKTYTFEFDAVTYSNATNFTISLGSSYSINGSLTASRIQKNELRYIPNSFVNVSGITYSVLSISFSNGVGNYNLKNIKLINNTIDKHIISWNPNTCDLSYTINGYKYNNIGFLSTSGNTLAPTCILCTNSNNQYKLNDLVGNKISDKYKSKMLFVNYDMASKANFHDENGDYILPNSISIDNSTVINNLSFNSIPNEKNWIDYYKSETKTFEYISNSNIVNISTTFSKISVTQSFTYSFNTVNDYTNEMSKIGNLLPNFYATSSVYSPIISTQGSVGTYSILMYRNMLVIKVPTSFAVSIGDIVRFNIDVLLEPLNLMVNKIVNIGSNNYVYFYTTFNESILNDIKYSGSTIQITNLNKFNNNTTLIDNINMHNISGAYGVSEDSDNYIIYPKYTNNTAYYNLKSNIIIDNYTYSMLYSDVYNTFGYESTYNILDYLSNIDPIVFTYSKSFDLMPILTNVTCNNNNVVIANNKLVFNKSKFDWYNSFLSNTFIDVKTYYNSTTYSNEQLLIIDKYETDTAYVLALNKALSTQNTISTLDIISRNKLGQISDDLKLLNNIQRSESKKVSSKNVTYTNLQNEIKSKYNTDNYTKVLLADKDIKKNLSVIIYEDYKNELSSSVLNTSIIKNYTIKSFSPTELPVCSDVYYGFNRIQAITSTRTQESGGLGIFATYIRVNAVSGITTSNSTSYTSAYDGLTYTFSNAIVASNAFIANRTFGFSYSKVPNKVYNVNFNLTYVYGYYFAFQLNGVTVSPIYGTNSASSTILPSSYTFSFTQTTSTASLTLNLIGTRDSANSNSFEFRNIKFGETICTTPDAKVKIELNEAHNLSIGDIVNLQTISSLSNLYNGASFVTDIIDDKTFYIDKPYYNSITYSVGNIGTVSNMSYDPYLIYQPYDLVKLGLDNNGSIALEVKDDNWVDDNGKVKLINISDSNYRFKLVDSLNVIDLYNKYKWFYEAEVTNAIIGEQDSKLVWYKGDFIYGRFFDGIWYSGRFFDGIWYDSKFYNKTVTVNNNSVSLSDSFTISNSTWYNGEFKNGEFNKSLWLNGTFFNGTMSDSNWANGQFQYGISNNNVWSGGTFINGIWDGGVFNSDNVQSYWFDGIWNSGDFENGIWYNGTFNKSYVDKPSRFGTKSKYNKESIWKTGTFNNGEVYANIEAPNDKLTIWESGVFNNAVWYNGTSHNIQFNNSVWYNGISSYIKIVAINFTNTSYEIIVDGLYNLPLNYKLYIINDKYDNNSDINNELFKLIGSNDNIKDYTVNNNVRFINNKYTAIPVQNVGIYGVVGYNYNTPSDQNIMGDILPIKIVSYFNKSDWYSGVWENGIFNYNRFISGRWNNGVFINGEWN